MPKGWLPTPTRSPPRSCSSHGGAPGLPFMNMYSYLKWQFFLVFFPAAMICFLLTDSPARHPRTPLFRKSALPHSPSCRYPVRPPCSPATLPVSGTFCLQDRVSDQLQRPMSVWGRGACVHLWLRANPLQKRERVPSLEFFSFI